MDGMEKTLQERIEKAKVIAILRGIESSVMQKVAEALYEGGIRFMEVTFDHRSGDFKQTANAIRSLCTTFAGKMEIGAGTVTTVELVHLATESGAKFIISPDCNTDVINETKKLGLVSIPGAFTASEVLKAHYAGADFVKVFPAGCMGPEYIKALRGPIPQVKLLAVGGIDAENIASFLKAGCVGAGVGGKLASKALIEEGKFDELEKAAAAMIDAAKVQL